MSLFYVPDIADSWELSQEEAAHAIRVLRLQAGDKLEITDGAGGSLLYLQVGTLAVKLFILKMLL